MKTPPTPTDEQCDKGEEVRWTDENGEERHGRACWYPAMGGYVAQCIVMRLDIHCFDVWIWHDGEFPFNDSGNISNPAYLHHCSSQQFIDFGQFVQSIGQEPS